MEEQPLDKQTSTTEGSKYSFRKTLKRLRELQNTEGYGQLTIKYLPFILNTVKKKHVKCNMKYTYEELLDEALLASLIAEKRYKPELGYDFTTYAKFDINGALTTYTTNLTKTQLELFVKLVKFVDKYSAANGKHPSKSSILKGLKISEERYTHLIQDLVPPTIIPYINVQDNGEESEIGIQDDESDSEVLVNDILKIISKLDAPLKDIIEMAVIQELSIDSIATYLKVAKPIAQGIIDSAKAELRDILELHGITNS